MGIMSWITNPAGAASDAVENVTESAGGGIMSFVTAPFRAIFSIPGKLIGGVTGAISGVIGSLWNGVKYTAIDATVSAVAPSIRDSVTKNLYGEEALRELRESREKNGVVGLIGTAAKEGFGLAAVTGAAGGALEGGGLLGGGLVMGTVLAVTMGALHKGDIQTADSSSAKLPPVVPGVKKTDVPAKG